MSKTLKQTVATVGKVFLLAEDLDEFMYDYEGSDYREDEEDTWLTIRDIVNHIVAGKTSYYKEYLEDIIDEEKDQDIVDEAEELLDRLERLDSVIAKAR